MAWVSNHIPLFYVYVITNPYPNPDEGLDNTICMMHKYHYIC